MKKIIVIHLSYPQKKLMSCKSDICSSPLATALHSPHGNHVHSLEFQSSHLPRTQPGFRAYTISILKLC